MATPEHALKSTVCFGGVERPFVYTLDENGKPVPCDHMTAAKLADDPEATRVDLTVIERQDQPDITVETYFFPYDHDAAVGLEFREHPLLWHTAVGYVPPLRGVRKYASAEEAAAGHKEVCASLQSGKYAIQAR